MTLFGWKISQQKKFYTNFIMAFRCNVEHNLLVRTFHILIIVSSEAQWFLFWIVWAFSMVTFNSQILRARDVALPSGNSTRKNGQRTNGYCFRKKTSATLLLLEQGWKHIDGLLVLELRYKNVDQMLAALHERRLIFPAKYVAQQTGHSGTIFQQQATSVETSL